MFPRLRGSKVGMVAVGDKAVAYSTALAGLKKVTRRLGTRLLLRRPLGEILTGSVHIRVTYDTQWVCPASLCTVAG